MADAPQAFEGLSSDSIEETLTFLFGQARLHITTGTISVAKGRPFTVACAGNPREKHRDWQGIFLSTLERVVRLYLQLQLYRVGEKIWQQISGVPIGGPISNGILKQGRSDDG